MTDRGDTQPLKAEEQEEDIIHVTEVTPEELMARIQRPDELMIVDMRQAWEYEAGHIPGAVNIFVQDIPARLKEFPKDKEIVFQCWHGNTSLGASAFLIENGWPESQVASLMGGIAGWAQAFGPDGMVKD